MSKEIKCPHCFSIFEEPVRLSCCEICVCKKHIKDGKFNFCKCQFSEKPKLFSIDYKMVELMKENQRIAEDFAYKSIVEINGIFDFIIIISKIKLYLPILIFQRLKTTFQ